MTMDAKKYFEPRAQQADIDKAALIVALVDNRESATRTDYAHARIKEIVAILQKARDERGQNGAVDPSQVVPSRIR